MKKQIVNTVHELYGNLYNIQSIEGYDHILLTEGVKELQNKEQVFWLLVVLTCDQKIDKIKESSYQKWTLEKGKDKENLFYISVVNNVGKELRNTQKMDVENPEYRRVVLIKKDNIIMLESELKADALEKVRPYTNALGQERDKLLPSGLNLELNLSREKEGFSLHLFNGNAYLFSITAKERRDIESYVEVNSLRIKNDFDKKIFK